MHRFRCHNLIACLIACHICLPSFAQEYLLEIKKTKVSPAANAALMKGIELCNQRSDQCLKYLDQAIKLDPKYIEAYYVKGCYFMFKGQFADAIKAYDRGIAIEKRFFQLTQNRAYCHAQLKHWPQALADYTFLIDNLPGNQRALHDRAQVYRHMGRIDLANKDIAAMHKAQEEEQDRRDKAGNPSIEEISKYIEKFPNQRHLYLHRGIAYKRKKRFKEAIADFSKLLTIPAEKGGRPLNYNLDQIYYDRAACYEGMSDFKNAIADYTRIIKMDPDAEEAYLYRGNCNSKLELWNEAIEDYTACIKNDKEPTPTAYKARAAAYEKLGKSQLAQKDLLKAKELSSPIKRN